MFISHFTKTCLLSVIMLGTSSTFAYATCDHVTTRQERQVAKYGTQEVYDGFEKMHKHMSKRELEAAIEAGENILSLPGITLSAQREVYNGISVVHTLKKDVPNAIIALENALALGGLNSYEIASAKATIEYMKIHGKRGDRDAQPLIRIPGFVPKKANRSGHCQLQFDVSTNGKVENANVVYCTERMFKKPSLKAVKKWRYNPKISNGKAEIRKDVFSKVSYKLLDECGNIIPEKPVK